MKSIFIPQLVTPYNSEKNVQFKLDQAGRILSRESNISQEDLDSDTLHFSPEVIALPGLVNAHSHGFQRLLRGPTQYRGPSEDSFWTWRRVMYQCLAQLNPDDIYTITKHLYLEMVASGTSHVGEFHYVHHQPDGTPYPDSLAMSKAIIAAAKDAGLRLTLLRTIYLRGDFDAEPQPQQRRFIDPDLKSVRASLDALIKLEDAHCTVGLAPHSVRAVSPDALRELKSGYRDRPFHIHVSEQPRENDGCQQHYGMSPVRLLEESECLDPRTVLVHATHVSTDDISAIAQRGAQVCFCPSTEADLGDGLGPARDYLKAGVSLSLGTDGQTFSSLLEEARRLEMNERLRLQVRNALPMEASQSSGSVCFKAATDGGRMALGEATESLSVGSYFDIFTVRERDPFIAGVAEDDILNAITFSLPSSHIESTWVAGNKVHSRNDTTQLEKSAQELQATRDRLFT